MNNLQVPFFRPQIGDLEINEVVETLRSGWLTSGKRVQLFEKNFAAAVGASHAVAVNSCTAALHLAVEALGLRTGQGVLVPTMTFAATAEVVRYLGAIPLLVDCDPVTGNMDLRDCELRIANCRDQRSEVGEQRSELRGQRSESKPAEIVGIIPVHVGGVMMDVKAIREFATANNVWVVEDAAHAFPAAVRRQKAVGRRQKAEIRGRRSELTAETQSTQRLRRDQKRKFAIRNSKFEMESRDSKSQMGGSAADRELQTLPASRSTPTRPSPREKAGWLLQMTNRWPNACA